MAALRLSDEETVRGVAAFLADANSLQEQWKTQDDTLVNAALTKCENEMDIQAAAIHAAITLASSGLLPAIDAGESLPQEHIAALNTAFELGLRAEIIPVKLAQSKPGDKQFGGLVQKVRKVCALDEIVLKTKLYASTEETLRNGGRDSELDSARKELKVQLDEDLWQNAGKHARALSQSDHQPLYHTVPMHISSSVDIMSWNVLEFPQMPEDARYAPLEAVRDGISPGCDALLEILEKKGKDQKEFLLQAMSSRHVVSMHMDLVLQEVQYALTERKVRAILLQEVSNAMRAHLARHAEVSGWHAHFAQANADPKKCDAVTCVISLEAFDETAELECLEGTKPRFFAAVRQGPTWIMSCHVPGEVLTKDQKKQGVPSHGNAAKATTTLEQIAGRFLPEGGSVDALVVGGDFNTNVQILKQNMVAAVWCGFVDLQAPDRATCLDVEWPIDGILTVRR